MVECCSSFVPRHIPVVQLLAYVVDLVAGTAYLEAAGDAVGSQPDRMCLDRTQPADILPGILETKRQKKKLPVGVLALREGPQGLGIATNM